METKADNQCRKNRESVCKMCSVYLCKLINCPAVGSFYVLLASREKHMLWHGLSETIFTEKNKHYY